MKVIREIRYGERPLNVLDVYYPNGKYSKVLIHFHGGGIVEGDKCDPSQIESGEWFANQGILHIEANYSMYPTAKFPDFLEDAAKVVKYVKENYSDPEGLQIYVSGQSAGAYLTLMLAMDTHYLEDEDVDPMDISGWLIDSAQTTAHFNVLKEFGDDSRAIIVDERGPQYFVNEDMKFTRIKLFFYTDDMPCRYEQNMLFYKSVLQFDPNAEIEYEVMEGPHCAGSTIKVNGIYPINPKFIEFMKK